MDRLIEVVEELGRREVFFLRRFFRRISLLHMMEEIEYRFEVGKPALALYVDDEGIQGVLHAYKAPPRARGLDDVRMLNVPFTSPHYITDVGMMMALHQRMLTHLTERKVQRVCYLVQNDDYLTNAVLSKWGFEPAKDVQSFRSREKDYTFVVNDVDSYLKAFRPDQWTVSKLLDHEIPDAEYEHHALLQTALQVSVRKEVNHGLVGKKACW